MHEVAAHIVVLFRAPLNGTHPVLGSTPVGDTKGTVVQGYVVKIATGRASISGVPVGLIIDYFALEQTDADVGEIANLIGTRGEIGGKGFPVLFRRVRRQPLFPLKSPPPRPPGGFVHTRFSPSLVFIAHLRRPRRAPSA